MTRGADGDIATVDSVNRTLCAEVRMRKCSKSKKKKKKKRESRLQNDFNNVGIFALHTKDN